LQQMFWIGFGFFFPLLFARSVPKGRMVALLAFYPVSVVGISLLVRIEPLFGSLLSSWLICLLSVGLIWLIRRNALT